MLIFIVRKGLKVEQILSYTHEEQLCSLFYWICPAIVSWQRESLGKQDTQAPPQSRTVERNVHQRDFLQDA